MECNEEYIASVQYMQMQKLGRPEYGLFGQRNACRNTLKAVSMGGS
jgi:hypothetical protein